MEGGNETHTRCGLHAHVAVPDLDHAVLVCNHLRPWLASLVALSANSPFRDGRDTGYASWRTAAGDRWPVAGPPPYFCSAHHYAQLCAALEDAGAVVGDHTLLRDVRPSSHLPTVEVRAMDVPVGVEQAARRSASPRRAPPMTIRTPGCATSRSSMPVRSPSTWPGRPSRPTPPRPPSWTSPGGNWPRRAPRRRRPVITVGYHKGSWTGDAVTPQDGPRRAGRSREHEDEQDMAGDRCEQRFRAGDRRGRGRRR
ncbi:glutamate-cysteine ligase family protein [Streptomyces albulus]|uniref:carboxylate-amine ligase n=1 Tax=Streptomyces noursei TaxID=1971 RepID=UPI001F2B61BC|nr:glutamate-cysteine ligase family protein [Streptomyces noursei]MCE4941772.1 glutamate-cysteine ligase family protein [Streptomyces noursei]